MEERICEKMSFEPGVEERSPACWRIEWNEMKQFLRALNMAYKK